jgi:hypothetical protein
MKRSIITVFTILMVTSTIWLLSGCGNPTGGGGASTSYNVITMSVTTEVGTTESVIGTIETDPAGTIFKNGTNVTIRARSLNQGYVFSHWHGCLTGECSAMILSMNGDKNVTAEFKVYYPTYYPLTLSISPSAGGTVSIYPPGGGTYLAGTVVTLSAEAASGYVFEAWSGNLNTSNSTETITMNGTKEITAVFEKTWTLVGGVAASDDRSYGASLFVYNGTPFVAYQKLDNPYNAVVRKFNGSAWETVGGTGLDESGSTPSIFVDDATPYIFYAGGVKKFSGTSWEVVGNNITGGGYNSLYFDNGTPYFACRGGIYGQTTVKKLNGVTWETIGSEEVSAWTSWGICLSVYSGTPYVADCSCMGNAEVRKFNGAFWETVGGAFSGGLGSHSLFICNGIPYLALVENDLAGDDGVLVYKYNGSNWELLGGGYAALCWPNDVSLFVYNDVPYVMILDGSVIYVKKFNGTHWEKAGTTIAEGTSASPISLYIDNGIPYVAYPDGSNDFKMIVKKLE